MFRPTRIRTGSATCQLRPFQTPAPSLLHRILSTYPRMIILRCVGMTFGRYQLTSTTMILPTIYKNCIKQLPIAKQHLCLDISGI